MQIDKNDKKKKFCDLTPYLAVKSCKFDIVSSTTVKPV